MNVLATASFLAFGGLLVLFGANATEIIDEFELDYAQFGLVGSMLSLGLGCGILLAGPAADRLPRRPLFVASCGAVALSGITLGPDSGYLRLLFQTATIGLGAGFYETILNACIVEESGRRAPRRLLFIHAAATLGASITPFAIAALRVPLELAWYDTFRAAGAIHLLLIFGAFLIPGRSDAGAVASPPALAAAPDPDMPHAAHASAGNDPRRLLLICLATFAYVGIESALTLLVGDHAQKDLGLGADRAARVIGFFWTGLLAGRLAVGLSPRDPSARTTALLALFAAAVVGLFGAGTLEAPAVAMGLTGFFLGGVFPIMIGIAGSTLPRSAGTAVGLAAGFGSLGGFVIPWLTGFLARGIGLASAIATLALWLLALAAASALAHRRPH